MDIILPTKGKIQYKFEEEFQCCSHTSLYLIQKQFMESD